MSARDVQTLFERIDQPGLRYHVFEEPSADNDVPRQPAASRSGGGPATTAWLRRYASAAPAKAPRAKAAPVRLDTLFRSWAQAMAAANAR